MTLTRNLIRNNIAATVAVDYVGRGGGILLFFSTSLLEEITPSRAILPPPFRDPTSHTYL